MRLCGEALNGVVGQIFYKLAHIQGNRERRREREREREGEIGT